MMDDNQSLDEALERRSSSMFDSDEEDATSLMEVAGPSQTYSSTSRKPRRRSMLGRSKSRSIRTPSSPMASTIPHNNLPSAPASPPTPAPSPSPHLRLADWSTVDEREELSHRDFRGRFKEASSAHKERILAELLNMCDNRQLIFVHNFVCPRLKKDPFTTLPNELCLRVGSLVYCETHMFLTFFLDPVFRGPS